MKILYFDCSSGVSGDMILGALMDAGLDPDVLKKGIRALNFKGASLEIKGEKRNGIKGTRVIVHTPKEKKTRGLRDILGLLDKGTLPSPVKTHAKAIFQLLAQVEAKVHCISIEKVHFHELGALDTIIDIVGACLAVHALKIKRIYTSALPLGSGKVKTRHGLLPVPAPAVVELLRGIPVYRDDADTELVTPTGAVIMKYFLKGNVGEMPQMMIDHVGYGVGAKHLKDRTNLLRVFIGTLAAQTDMQMDKVHVLETQIDDMSPELFGKLFENLLSIGALDANWIPVHMKNNRPGFQLQVIVKKGDSEKIADFIFQESTTLGIRIEERDRYILPRKHLRMKTSLGPCSIKLAYHKDHVHHVKPEMRDVAILAKKKKKALKDVHQLITEEAEKKYLGKGFS